MPEITLENDPTVFIVTVRDKGRYSIDAYELNHEVIAKKPPSMSIKKPEDLTADEAVEDQAKVVEATRPLLKAEADSADIAALTDSEVFAIASKVLTRLKQLGNE